VGGGGLRGPGTVRLYAWGEFQGKLYMVTELLEGKNLEKLLHEVRRIEDVRTAVTYMMQACEALAEAHRFKIVHRDIKPANLFLDERTGRIRAWDLRHRAECRLG
jgi:serine/threonine-protein kinase